MNKIILVVIILISTNSFAAGSLNNEFGFGIQVGDPTAVTMKKWLNRENAFQISLGGGSFSGLRLTGDYLWEFDAFNSRNFKVYAGPGAVIGLGKGSDAFYKQDEDNWYYKNNSGFGLAARGLAGINYVNNSSKIEVFIELGVLVGLAPDVGALSESALGIRFYFN